MTRPSEVLRLPILPVSILKFLLEDNLNRKHNIQVIFHIWLKKALEKEKERETENERERRERSGSKQAEGHSISKKGLGLWQPSQVLLL